MKAQLFEAFPDDPPLADPKWAGSYDRADRAAIQQLVLQRPAVRVTLSDLRSLSPSHFVQGEFSISRV